MTVLPRAATSPELAYLRSDGQASRLFLTFFNPSVVYTARMTTAPASTDSVATISYDNGSGAAYADVLPDQTLLVGTTPSGFDLGMARVRNLVGLGATSGTMNIGETSEIAWQNGCYLTVLDEFLLWPRHPTVTSTVTYMDYDVAYVNQHRYCDSIPVLGPDRVVWLTGATVDVPFDGSQSWPLNNTITDYLWTAPGASATSGLTTATPTITYNATGTYRVGLQITNSDGVTFTGYRRVFVVTEASGVITTFQLAGLQGSYSSGGWSFQVKMSENAALPTLRDRMQVILHAKDNYGTTQTSLGYVAGSENVIAIGWINQESIQWQREDLPGVVTFTVEGPHYWLNRMAMFPTGIKDRNSHPTKWTRFFGLNAKAIAWHLLHWRTTATRCIDVYPANSTWRGARFDAPGSQTIWQQLSTILENSVIAKPCCDRYARLFMQIEQNLLSTTDRASIPSVMTIAKGDWTNEVTFDRRIVDDAAYVDLSGVAWDGATPTAFFSLSPGHVFRHYGSVEIRERLVLYDQATTNTLCGAYWGWKNNPYPRMAFNLAMNNRLIDLAPYQYMTVDIAAADTPRGFISSALRVIPRAIRYNWVEQAFALTTDMEVEAETSIGLSVTGDTPPDPPDPPDPPPIPPLPPPPVPVPNPTGNMKELWFATNSPSAIVWSSDFLGGGQPTWQKMTALPQSTDIVDFVVIQDGSGCFAFQRHPISLKYTIYECTNFAAVRAAPATTPTWSAILTEGDVVSSNIGAITVPGALFLNRYGTKLIIAFQVPSVAPVYGEYVSGAWTFTAIMTYALAGGKMGPDVVVVQSFGGPQSQGLDLRDKSNTLIGVTAVHTPVNGISKVWRSTVNADYYAVRFHESDPPFNEASVTNYAFKFDLTNSSAANIGAIPANAGSFAATTSIRGALSGVSLLIVSSYDGGFYLSEDRASVTNPATWAAGIVEECNLSGGQSLAWWLLSATNGSEFIRISNDRGAVWSAMTGNFWTTIQLSGDLTGVNMFPVF